MHKCQPIFLNSSPDDMFLLNLEREEWVEGGEEREGNINWLPPIPTQLGTEPET